MVGQFMQMEIWSVWGYTKTLGPKDNKYAVQLVKHDYKTKKRLNIGEIKMKIILEKIGPV